MDGDLEVAIMETGSMAQEPGWGEITREEVLEGLAVPIMVMEMALPEVSAGIGDISAVVQDS